MELLRKIGAVSTTRTLQADPPRRRDVLEKIERKRRQWAIEAYVFRRIPPCFTEVYMHIQGDRRLFLAKKSHSFMLVKMNVGIF